MAHFWLWSKHIDHWMLLHDLYSEQFLFHLIQTHIEWHSCIPVYRGLLGLCRWLSRGSLNLYEMTIWLFVALVHSSLAPLSFLGLLIWSALSWDMFGCSLNYISIHIMPWCDDEFLRAKDLIRIKYIFDIYYWNWNSCFFLNKIYK